jgi:hypothetical protein
LVLDNAESLRRNELPPKQTRFSRRTPAVACFLAQLGFDRCAEKIRLLQEASDPSKSTRDSTIRRMRIGSQVRCRRIVLRVLGNGKREKQCDTDPFGKGVVTSSAA